MKYGRAAHKPGHTMTLRLHLEAIRAISDVDADGWFPERSRNRDIQKHAVAALRLLNKAERTNLEVGTPTGLDPLDWRLVLDPLEPA